MLSQENLLLEQAKAILQAQELVENNYASQLAKDFDPISYLHPYEPDISRVLAQFLDPKGSHCQGSLWLDAFIEELKRNPETLTNFGEQESNQLSLQDIPMLSDHADVMTEYPLSGQSGRLDIFIEDRQNKCAIAIENKPFAGDQENQLKRYAEWLNDEGNYDKWVIVFLCDREPSEWSIPKDSKFREKIIRMDFSQMALILRKAAQQCESSKVRFFVELFAEYIKRNISGESVMENKALINLISTKTENIRAAQEIVKNYDGLIQSAWNKFVDKVANKAFDLYGNDLDFSSSGRDSLLKQHPYLGFRAKGDSPWGFFIEAQSNNLRDFCWGVGCWTSGQQFPKGSQLSQDLSEFMISIFGEASQNAWWPWYRYGEEIKDVNNCSDLMLFPRHLNEPEWLYSMINEDDDRLVNMFFSKLEAIFPRDKKEEWPRFNGSM